MAEWNGDFGPRCRRNKECGDQAEFDPFLPVVPPQQTRQVIAQLLPFVALSSILDWKQKLPFRERSVADALRRSS
jgi:hypothetical protein